MTSTLRVSNTSKDDRMNSFTMTSQTLANCGVDPIADEIAMAQCLDIPNSWLPSNLRNEKSYHVTDIGNEEGTKFKSKKVRSTNAAKILGKIKEVETIKNNKQIVENELQAKNDRLNSYYLQTLEAEYTEINFGELSLSQQAAIDNNYIKCYGDFVRLGIVEPITQDEIDEFEELRS